MQLLSTKQIRIIGNINCEQQNDIKALVNY